MKFVIAMMKHETNSFSPVPTPLERFCGTGPIFGDAVVAEFRGTQTPTAAYIDLAESLGAEYVTPVAAEAMPSAPTSSKNYDDIVQPIVDAVAQGCDAVLLDLHGGQISEGARDAEAELLARIRAVAPTVPIGVSFDLHANISERTVALATVTNGYKTYPHIDMYETGRRVGEVIVDTLRGAVRPVSAWGHSRILVDTLKMGTDDGPMRTLTDEARRIQGQAGILTATVYGGFPLGDFEDVGMTVVVTADGDQVRARRETDRLLDLAWTLRAELTFTSQPLEQSIARAKQITEGPVLLIDYADNCASGGTQDTMTVVREVIRQGLEDVAVGAICDPQAVAELVAAGIGAQLTIELGGKRDMPSIKRAGEPLTVTGKVRSISDGEFVITGPMYTGVRTHMGRTVVFDTGRIQFVVTERNVEPWDAGVFTSAGIVPQHKRYLLLKSRVNYRAAFKPMAKAIIECNGTGVTTSDLLMFSYRHLKRPIYPMDALSSWRGV